MHQRALRFSWRTFGAAALAVAIAGSSITLLSQSQTTPQDSGASGVWQRLQKLKTTASAMHTTAHPDDEHGGVITKVSRKDGARLALMTLNRGESGDNAIGPELFDGLGLIQHGSIAHGFGSPSIARISRVFSARSVTRRSSSLVYFAGGMLSFSSR